MIHDPKHYGDCLVEIFKDRNPTNEFLCFLICAILILMYATLTQFHENRKYKMKEKKSGNLLWPFAVASVLLFYNFADTR